MNVDAAHMLRHARRMRLTATAPERLRAINAVIAAIEEAIGPLPEDPGPSPVEPCPDDPPPAAPAAAMVAAG